MDADCFEVLLARQAEAVAADTQLGMSHSDAHRCNSSEGSFYAVSSVNLTQAWLGHGANVVDLGNL